MSSKDPSMSAELRFDLPEFEPDAVLVEQLSLLAAAPSATGVPTRRLSRRAAAGVFAGLLLASGTAYAARGHITPVFNAVIGHGSHHRAHPIPEPSASPTPSDATTEPLAPQDPPSPSAHQVGRDDDQGQNQRPGAGQGADGSRQQASPAGSDDNQGQQSGATPSMATPGGNQDTSDSSGSGSGADGSGAGQQ